ncbi:hypothetical protein FQV37_1106 [Psychrobacter nivimaris]|jgi:hypothetical protein|uniref:Uncharacterized protein n=1 Tax=Psychrobacter nivimaris TaxID=281738 RepID=A0A6N7C0U1_9GAMM|nr:MULTISPECIES: hypothetical protein [Psychrobacter]KAF0568380.1 hypothetical protein FQV37_1106 [Psychrobacter nivimaris]NRD70677.1 hypothetical protein [Psychrobacter okhotskensis]|tara:strand:- start:1108 stop:1314 length:207 start_codon:yes stop_codon:yes gene_type:complete
MNKSNDTVNHDNHQLKDADDNNGIVPDDALQKANPAAAEQETDDHDPHNVAKNTKQYDSPLMEDKKQS